LSRDDDLTQNQEDKVEKKKKKKKNSLPSTGQGTTTISGRRKLRNGIGLPRSYKIGPSPEYRGRVNFEGKKEYSYQKKQAF